eukprot:1176222-Prorocentrum_minimum.AAC.1
MPTVPCGLYQKRVRCLDLMELETKRVTKITDVDLGLPCRRLQLIPLWLHARKYIGQGWEYECPLPKWAGEGYIVDALRPGESAPSVVIEEVENISNRKRMRV